jgi:subtilase family serine protease
MANKDLTEIRVRNVMNQIPKSAMAKREGKIRNTVRSTMSSMKTVLGQLKQGNMNKLRNEKRRKKITVITILAIVVIIIVIAAIIIFR